MSQVRKLTQGRTAHLKHKWTPAHHSRGCAGGVPRLRAVWQAPCLAPAACLPGTSQIGSCQASSGGWATCQVLSLHQASLITAQVLVFDENHSAQEASGTAERCSVPSATALGTQGHEDWSQLPSSSQGNSGVFGLRTGTAAFQTPCSARKAGLWVWKLHPGLGV